MNGRILSAACVSLLLLIAMAAEAKSSPETAMRTVMEFDGAPSEPRWVTVNDGVMGGRSRGALTVEDGTLNFSGTLSLENNGGFSSIRTVDYAVDLSDVTAVVLRVRGDGRRYQLRLASDARFRGFDVAYRADFLAPAGEWTEVRLNLDSLQPSVRGTLLNGPPLDPARVRQIGVLLGDKQPGPFALAIDWIGVE